MLGYPVRLTLQEIRRLPSSAVSALAEATDSGATVGLQIQIHGESAGWILIVLPLPTVYRVLQDLMGTPAEPRDLTGTERSAVQEVGNIVASSFLSELGDLLDRRLLPSVPAIHLDNIPRLVRDVLASAHIPGAEALVVHAILQGRERAIQGQVFVVADVSIFESTVRGAPGERGVSR
jgi:chemotaxis protein CheC